MKKFHEKKTINIKLKILKRKKMFFFLLVIQFVLIVHSQQSCGINCMFSISETKLIIETNGIIEESYFDQMDSIKTIEIKGNIISPFISIVLIAFAF